MTPEIKKLKKKVERLEKRKEEVEAQLELAMENLEQAEEDFADSTVGKICLFFDEEEDKEMGLIAEVTRAEYGKFYNECITVPDEYYRNVIVLSDEQVKIYKEYQKMVSKL